MGFTPGLPQPGAPGSAKRQTHPAHRGLLPISLQGDRLNFTGTEQTKKPPNVRSESPTVEWPVNRQRGLAGLLQDIVTSTQEFQR